MSCEDLTEANENPTAYRPEAVNPNLVLPTVLTEAAKAYVNLGYQDIAGVVQHTQKDAWSSGHNDYDWGGSQDWAPYYAILRNNALVYDRAVELKMEFHQGVTLVMKSFMFGFITDLWGDAPYTNALKGELLGENIKPSYDSQDVIYAGILATWRRLTRCCQKEAKNTTVLLEMQTYISKVILRDGGNLPTHWRSVTICGFPLNNPMLQKPVSKRS
jgi:hypothetical protein